MDSLEVTWIAAEIVSILQIIHLSQLIFVKFHVIQLVVIKIKSVPFTRYLLKIFLITEFIMHTNAIVNWNLMVMFTLYHMKVCRYYTMLLYIYL